MDEPEVNIDSSLLLQVQKVSESRHHLGLGRKEPEIQITCENEDGDETEVSIFEETLDDNI